MNRFKNNIKRLAIVSAFAAMAVAGTSAQNTESAFWTDGYLYRYQMNPAFGNDKSFISFPALSNLDFTLAGTLNAQNFLYNVDGKTTTFMNPKVSANEFLSKIKDRNSLNIDLRETLLATGFKAFGGYNTLGLSVRSNIGMYLPGDLFRMLKEGVSNKTYNIANLGAQANAWVELSLGHSREIIPGLRAGINLKLLVGAGNLTADFRRAELALGTDSWDITADAELNASVVGLEYETDYNENTNREYVSGVKFNTPGVGGFGFAVDLGATYEWEDFTFALSIADLGGISWQENHVASTDGVQTVKTSDYVFNVDDNQPNNFTDELDRIKDKLSYIYELKDMGNKGGRTTGIGATLYAGAEYTFPLYSGLKFGLLNSTRIQGDYSWTNFRLSANIHPVKFFSAGINYGIGTFGSSFGWIFNITTTGINFSLGMDHLPGKLAKQGVPLSSNAEFNFGINIPF